MHSPHSRQRFGRMRPKRRCRAKNAIAAPAGQRYRQKNRNTKSEATPRKISHAIRHAASLPAVRNPSVNASENGSTSRTPVFRQIT